MIVVLCITSIFLLDMVGRSCSNLFGRLSCACQPDFGSLRLANGLHV